MNQINYHAFCQHCINGVGRGGHVADRSEVKLSFLEGCSRAHTHSSPRQILGSLVLITEVYACIYIYAYMHACIHASMPASMHAYVQAC